MKKKIKDNKGISLVEILVSLAIVSLMIIPIAMVVNTVIKMNKKSEDRQQAVLLGQQVLEEINILEEINKHSITLSRGKKFIGKDDNDKENDSVYILEDYENRNDKYDIKIEISKNKNIEYDSDDSNNEDDDINPTTQNIFTIESEEGDYIRIGYKNIWERLKIDTEDARLDISIYGGNKLKIEGSEGNTIEYSSVDSIYNQIVFNFTSNYNRNKGITISINSSSSDEMKFYIQKSFECEEKIYVEKEENIKIYNIRDNKELLDKGIGNLYNISVIVSKKGDILFEGNGSKNIKYKD